MIEAHSADRATVTIYGPFLGADGEGLCQCHAFGYYDCPMWDVGRRYESINGVVGRFLGYVDERGAVSQ